MRELPGLSGEQRLNRHQGVTDGLSAFGAGLAAARRAERPGSSDALTSGGTVDSTLAGLPEPLRGLCQRMRGK